MPNQIIYSSRLSIELHLRRTYLESHGIKCRIDGEALLSARPELPGYATLVVLDPEQLTEAEELLRQFEKEGHIAAGQTWVCPSCKETIEGQFSECWNCGFSKSSWITE